MSDGAIVFRLILCAVAAYLLANGSHFLWMLPALLAAAPDDGGGDADPCMGE